jgi:hypothetical protein
MDNFKTMHIFGYGEIQMLTKTDNVKVKSNTLESFTTFLDYFGDLFNADLTMGFHVIHIFNNNQVRLVKKSSIDDQNTIAVLNNSNITVKWSDINVTLINDLVNEITQLN